MGAANSSGSLTGEHHGYDRGFKADGLELLGAHKKGR